MIWLFIACLLALVLVLEQYWADQALGKLRYFCSCSDLLAEPEQVVTFTSGVPLRRKSSSTKRNCRFPVRMAQVFFIARSFPEILFTLILPSL